MDIVMNGVNPYKAGLEQILQKTNSNPMVRLARFLDQAF